MAEIRGIQAVWALGAVGGLAIVIETAAIGMIVMIAMMVAGELAVGIHDADIDYQAEWWALYSAPLWAPIAVGDALRRMESITGMSLSSGPSD